MRWLVTSVLALALAFCLVGAGASRVTADRHIRDGSSKHHGELSAASHLVAKLAPRRISAHAPEQRLADFTIVDGAPAPLPPPVAGWHSEPAPRASPALAPRHVRSSRGPPG